MFLGLSFVLHQEAASQLILVKPDFYASDSIVSPRFLTRCVLSSPSKDERYFVCELPR